MPVCVLSPSLCFCSFPPFVTRAIVSRLTAARALRALYRVTGRAAPAWSHTFLGISFHILIAVRCIASLFFTCFTVPAAASRVAAGSRLLNATECSFRWRCAIPPAPRCAPVLWRNVTESCHRARFRRRQQRGAQWTPLSIGSVPVREFAGAPTSAGVLQCTNDSAGCALCSTCLLCVLHFVLVCRFVVIIYRPDLLHSSKFIKVVLCFCKFPGLHQRFAKVGDKLLTSDS